MKPNQTTNEKSVMKFLRENARGRRHARFAEDIAADLGLSTRGLRRIIARLVKNGERIGSHPDLGFYLELTRKDRDVSLAPKIGLLRAVAARIRQQHGLTYRELCGQLRLV
jgi:DNA-binding Lrp family transcriptional regulator